MRRFLAYELAPGVFIAAWFGVGAMTITPLLGRYAYGLGGEPWAWPTEVIGSGLAVSLITMSALLAVVTMLITSLDAWLDGRAGGESPWSADAYEIEAYGCRVGITINPESHTVTGVDRSMDFLLGARTTFGGLQGRRITFHTGSHFFTFPITRGGSQWTL